jgi:multicomponent K+:H+ antiporter subunit E
MSDAPREAFVPGPRTWLPHPVWSVLLTLIWLALNGTASAGHVLLGAALGWGLPFWLQRYWPAPPRRGFRSLRTVGRSLAFAALVTWDVVIANLQVARAVLSPIAWLKPGFALVPIELEDPRAISILAHTITLTPGTVSVDVAADRRSLIVHALHMPDPDATVREIRQRYERRIAAIFGEAAC